MKNNTSLEEQVENVLVGSLEALGKPSKIIDVARHAYDNYEGELRPYQWQYDLRWSASKSDKVVSIKVGRNSLWALKIWEE